MPPVPQAGSTVEVAHLEVRDPVGVQVEIRELRRDEVEEILLGERLDLQVELELLDHVPRVGREAGDVAAQVAGELWRVVEQAREVELRGVVEALTGRRLQHRVEVLDLPAQLRVLREHRLLRRLQHGVEPAQHRERQDHPPVLRLLVDAAQLVGDPPDQIGVRANRRVAHRAPMFVTDNRSGRSAAPLASDREDRRVKAVPRTSTPAVRAARPQQHPTLLSRHL